MSDRARQPAVVGGEPAFGEGLPFFRPAKPPMEKVVERLTPSYDSGMLTNSRLRREFEEAVAERLGVPHVIAVASCTAGLMLVTQSGTGQPSAGTTWALSAIAAVVVGGTPLTGGGGGIGQTIIGTLLLGVMSNILNLTSVSPYWQPAATGLLVLAAVGVERYRSRGRS